MPTKSILSPKLSRLLLALIVIGIAFAITLKASAATLVLSVRESNGSNMPPTYIAKFDTETKTVTKFPAIPAAYITSSITGGRLMHDIVSTPDGNLSFMTGIYSEVSMVTYNQGASTWSSSPLLSGWAVNSNGTSGGVTSSGNVVYVADMSNPGGYIRTGAGIVPTRQTGLASPIDISYHAGKMYGLNGYGSPRNQIEILDTTSGLTSYLTLSDWQDYRALAVTQDSIFVATWGGDILRLSHQGTVLGSLRVNIPRGGDGRLFNARFNDINIAPNGIDIALGTADGYIALTTTALNSYSYADVVSANADGDVFVDWQAVPEPSTSFMVIIFGFMTCLRRKRC